MKKDKSSLREERLLKESIIIRRKVYELSKSFMFLQLANLNLARGEDEEKTLMDKVIKSQNILSSKLNEAIDYIEPLVSKGNPNIDLDHYWKLLLLWKHEIECC